MTEDTTDRFDEQLHEMLLLIEAMQEMLKEEREWREEFERNRSN